MGRLSPAAQLHIFLIVLTQRHAFVGDIGDRVDNHILSFLQCRQLSAVLGNLVGKLLHLRQNRGNVLALFLILRDQLRRTILLRLHVIHCHIDRTPLCIYFKDFVNFLVHIFVAALHGSLYPLGVLSYHFNIQHQNLPSFCVFLSVYYSHSVPAWQAVFGGFFRFGTGFSSVRRLFAPSAGANRPFRPQGSPPPAGSAAAPPVPAAPERPAGGSPALHFFRRINRRPAAYPPDQSNHRGRCTQWSEYRLYRAG